MLYSGDDDGDDYSYNHIRKYQLNDLCVDGKKWTLAFSNSSACDALLESVVDGTLTLTTENITNGLPDVM